MTEQEQIEEMDIMINNHITNGLLSTRWLAEALYNAGYRKVADNHNQRKKHRFRTWWRNKFGR